MPATIISNSGIFICLAQHASYVVFIFSFIDILMKPVIQLSVIKSIIQDFYRVVETAHLKIAKPSSIKNCLCTTSPPAGSAIALIYPNPPAPNTFSTYLINYITVTEPF